jgi:hypothetical protein
LFQIINDPSPPSGDRLRAIEQIATNCRRCAICLQNSGELFQSLPASMLSQAPKL